MKKGNEEREEREEQGKEKGNSHTRGKNQKLENGEQRPRHCQQGALEGGPLDALGSASPPAGVSNAPPTHPHPHPRLCSLGRSEPTERILQFNSAK